MRYFILVFAIGLLAFAPPQLPIPRRTFTPAAGNGRVAAFSAAGRLVAVGGGAPAVGVFETRTGLLLRTYAGHEQAVTDLAFAPNADSVLSVDAAGQVHLWHAESLATLARWKAPAPLLTVAFSPRGGRAVLASAQACWLWSLSGTQAPTLLKLTLPAKSRITTVAFGAEGRQLALGFDSGAALVYDLGTRSQTNKALSTTAVRSLSLLADTLLAATGSPDLKVWPVRADAPVVALPLPQALTAVAAQAGSRYLALGFDSGETLLWNRATRQAEFEGRGKGTAHRVQFQPDGPLVLATYEGDTPKTWLVPALN